MYVVVCYDIVGNSARSRLHRNLRALLTPVQKSVFEGEIPTSSYADLVRMIHGIVDHETDTVRIYHLPGTSRQLTEHLGTSHIVEPHDADIIF